MRSAPTARPARSTERLRVLIVAPDAGIAAAMQTALQQAGMAPELAATGAEALQTHAEQPAGIAVIDIDLPDMDGTTLVSQLTHAGKVGVIAIAGDAAAASRLRAIPSGADDIVAKPLALKELVARIRALHRRRARPAGPPQPAITLDHETHSLADPTGRRTAMTDAEFAALTTLLDAEGASVSREWLGRTALRRLLHEGDTAVDALIDTLRRKLAEHGAPPRTIVSARGQGYVIADPTVFAEGTAGTEGY